PHNIHTKEEECKAADQRQYVKNSHIHFSLLRQLLAGIIFFMIFPVTRVEHIKTVSDLQVKIL
ncbi:MAG: hypothetical protein IKD01_02130, partial [Oscillospiraceae bacterium]|nr:hypothetical protein [Oscillospiraceae bacterium]